MERHPTDWYPRDDRRALTKICEAADGLPPGAAVEVGCWTGQSTEILCSYLGQVLCVDPWGDMEYADRPDHMAFHMYENFRRNTQELPVVRFRCGWENFFKIFDGPLAFIHIDAVHEYDHVKRNIESALPYAVPGTVFCGHDYCDRWPGVREAVDEMFGDKVRVESWVWHVVL